MPCYIPEMRLTVIASILLLTGCAVPTERVQPPMDYPPGAFHTRDSKPKDLPCMAGTLLCSPQGG